MYNYIPMQKSFVSSLSLLFLLVVVSVLPAFYDSVVFSNDVDSLVNPATFLSFDLSGHMNLFPEASAIIDTWKAVNSGTDKRLLAFNDYFFPNWMVGNDGTVRSSSNYYNYASKNIVTDKTLRGVAGDFPLLGAVVVGDGGSIYYTQNKGLSWTSGNSGTTEDLFDVIYSKDGLAHYNAVGNNGTFLTTIGTGANWSSKSTGTNSDLRSLFFTSYNNGWAVGTDGTIIATGDRGVSWSTQSSGVTTQLSDVYFTDDNKGWVVGHNGVILATTDGGSTWNAQISDTNSPLNSIYMRDSNTGLIVGRYGTILSTIDGGATWVPQDSGITSPLHDVVFRKDSITLALGNNGILLKGSAVKPLLDNSVTPSLDLNTGTLSLGFNETIDTSATNLSKIMITDSNGDNGISLANGATLSGSDSDVLTITLSESQRQSIISLQNGTNLQITVSDNAVYDLYRNSFAGITDGELTVTLDTTAPTLDDATPDLSLRDGTLSFDFDETIDASATTLSGITITDSNGENRVTLTGATLPDTNSDILVLSLNEVQRQSLTLLQYGANAATPLQVDVSVVTINDTSGNSYTGITNADLTNIRVLPVDTWESKESGINERLLAVHFTDLYNGWAAGNNGTALQTTNGGADWSLVDIGAGVNVMRDIHFAGTDRGWAVGNNGVIRHTANGGSTWSLQTNNNNSTLFDAYFINTDRGWAVGGGGTVVATVNGGTTWSSKVSGTSSPLRGVHFTDSNNGWAVGAGGTVIATVDGGTTWAKQTGGVSVSLNDVHFTDSNNGWAVGAGGIVITTSNGGTLWSTQDSGGSSNLNGVHFTDLERGWAVGGGTVIYTNDGGATWNGQSTPVNVTMYDIHFTDSEHGWVVGNTGVILRGFHTNVKPPLLIDTTPDLNLLAGTLSFSFDETVDASATMLSGITITDRFGQNGVVLTGATLPGSDSDVLVVRLNEAQRQSLTLLQYGADAGMTLYADISASAISDLGGNKFAGMANTKLTNSRVLPVDTWESKESGTSERLLTIHFIDSDNGWAAGNDGAVSQTTNGGADWSLVDIGANEKNARDIHFVGTDRGWVVGDGGMIRYTADGGTNWSLQTSNTNSTLFDVYFISSDRGWAVGDGGTIVATVNGGTTWSSKVSGTTSSLRGIHFTDSDNGWAVGAGGTVIATVDGGTTWSSQDSGSVYSNLNDVHFTDSDNGWVVGAGGTILYTYDGGAIWNPQNNGFSLTLNSVHFTDSDNGWAAGADGTVIYTYDGGITWGTQDNPIDVTLFGVHFTDLEHGWVVGNTGTVLRGFYSDVQPPLLVDATPNFDLMAGTLSFSFDETVDFSAISLSRITLTSSSSSDSVALDGATLPDTNSNVLVIKLTDTQRRDIAALNRDSNDTVQVNVSTNAIRDISGNNFAGLVDAELGITVDNTAPTLTDNTPDLDLGAGTLSFAFNETVNVSAIVLSGIVITDSNSANGVSLTGATLPAADSATLVIDLNAVQKQEITLLNTGANTPLQVDVSATAIQDFARNNFAGLVNVDLEIIADTIAPTLTDDTPKLDLGADTLSFTFDEIVDVSATVLSGIAITDSNGANGVTLTDATLSATDSATIVISFNAAQKLEIVTLNNGANTPVKVDVSATAVRDIAGNTFAGLDGQELIITADTTAPILVDTTPSLNLESGKLPLRFNEPIDVSAIILSGITITLTNSTNSTDTDIISLNATLPDTDSDTLTITLTETQKDKLFNEILVEDFTAQLNVNATAIADLAGNNFVGLVDNELSIFARTTDKWVLIDNIGASDNHTLRAVHFVDSNNGWIVGSGSDIIFHTSDAGLSWTEQKINTPRHFNDVHFADLNHGWAVGQFRGSYYTDNGGDNWTHRPTDSLLGIYNNVYSVHAIDSNNVWGGSSSLYNTSNGGLVWDLKHGSIPSPRVVFFLDSNIGWVVGVSGSIQKITYNSDGGTSRTDQTSNKYRGELYSVHFIDPETGWAVGDTTNLIRTTDGGTSWNTVNINADNSSYAEDYFAVHFIDSKRGWIVGSQNKVLTSNDGGTTWSNQQHPNGNLKDHKRINDVYFPDSRHGWIVGANGYVANIVFSDDTPPLLTDTTPNLDLGADTLSFVFDEIIDVSAVTLSEITITDSSGTNEISLAGATLSDSDSDTLVLSLNEDQRQAITLLQYGADTTPLQIDVTASAIADLAGNRFAGISNAELTIDSALLVNTWESKNSEGVDTRLLDVHFINSTNGWAVGNDGTVLYTTDAGTIWSADVIANYTGTIRDIYFVDSENGWVVGDGGTVIATTDGGSNWTSQTTNTTVTLFAVYFIDSKNGWASGRNGTVIATTDGGTTWSLQVSGTTGTDLRGIHFVNSARGWAAGTGNTIITTADGGTIWSKQTNGISGSATLIDMHFIDSNRGWIVEQSGKIITTTDGGTTWSAQDSGGTNRLSGIYFPDSEHGWTAGADGIIRHTVNGGITWHTQTTPDNAYLHGIHFSDALHGWAVGNDGTILRGFHTDAKPPLLVDASPGLDLRVGTVSFEFDEIIDVSETMSSEITITDNNGENGISLVGATLPDTDSNTLTITINATQRLEIIALNAGANGPVKVNVSATAISDLAGNAFAGITGAKLADATAPILNDLTPDLDLQANTISFEFDEVIDVSETMLSEITITDNNGENGISLAGATLPVSDSTVLTITLNPTQRLDIVTLRSVDDIIKANVSATAVLDLVGNAFAGIDGAELELATDSIAPLLVDNTPDIDLESNTLSFVFDELVDVSATSLSGITITDSNGANSITLTGATLPAVDSATLVITLNSTQRQEIIAIALGANNPALVNVSATTIKDLAGNAFAGIDAAKLEILADNRAPLLVDNTPDLDLGIGTLLFAFDELIYVSATSLSGITITDSNGSNGINLTGATLPVDDSATLVITLNAIQRHAIAVLNAGMNTPVQVNVSATAVKDFAENTFAGLDGRALAVTADSTGPLLIDNTPNLNLRAGTLQFTFDEVVDVSDIVLSGIVITDSNGANDISLTGATLPAVYSNILVITLNAVQKQEITLLNTGTNTPLQVDVSATAIRDFVGNTFAGLTNASLEITVDKTAPTLIDNTPKLDLGADTLSFTFDEVVDVSATVLSGIAITDSNGANGVTLTDATLSATDSATLVISLSSAQKLEIVTLNNGANTPVKVNVSATAVQDLAGNTFAGLDGQELTITADTIAPILIDTTPDLDLRSGKLSFRFDEPIDVSATVLSGITITLTNSTNSTDTDIISLNATLPDTDSDTLTITLTETQKDKLVNEILVEDFTAQLNVNATAITDLAGNNFAGLVDNELTILVASVTNEWETRSLGDGVGIIGFAIHFVDSNNGWVAGGYDNGIYYTSNAGLNWSKQRIGDDRLTFYDVHFTDLNHGWAVGNFKGSYYTTNGGKTWTFERTGPGGNQVHGVHAIDSKNVWAASNNLYSSSDGGKKWNVPHSSLGNYNLNFLDVFFLDSNLGWGVGSGNKIYHTINGGTAWSRQNTPSSNTLYSVHFIDSTTGWAVGSAGTIVNTANGGLNWYEQNSNTNNSLNAVHFIDSKRGWAVGLANTLIVTTDGGLTWSNDPHPYIRNLDDVYFSDSTNGWISGESGYVAHITLSDDTPPLLTDATPDLDLGAGTLSFVFDEIIDVSAVTLSEITITDNNGTNEVSLAGATLSDSDSDTLMLSLNEDQRQAITLLQYGADTTPLQIDVTASAIADLAGNRFAGISNTELTIDSALLVNTWESKNSEGVDTRLLDVHFINSTNGWAVGNDGIVLYTTDAGTMWTAADIGNYNGTIRDIYFVDSMNGWVVGNVGTVIATTDGGINWTSQTTNNTNMILFAVYFIDSKNGWASGRNGTVIATIDGGNTWSLQDSGTTGTDLRGIHFVNSARGWAAGTGNTIITTADGGTTWSNQTSGVSAAVNLVDVHFVNSTRGWMLADDGKIVTTTNGGTTWSVQDSGVTNRLSGIHFVDSDHGWLAGSSGTIRHTVNGGITWHTQTTPDNAYLRGIHFTDALHGWAVGNDGTILRGFHTDVTPPLLVDASPGLDLRVGTVSFEFDEIIDASATILSGITITDNNGENGISLAGATLPDTDSNTLTITINATQRLEIIALNAGANGPVKVNVSTIAISDLAGNAFAGVTGAELTITTDNIAPVIMLNGNTTIQVALNGTYNDLGAICNDNVDGVLTSNIVTVSTVNVTASETYTVTYNCMDTSGNSADTVTRTVTVTAAELPILTLIGNDNILVPLDVPYVDQGAICTDISGRSIIPDIDVSAVDITILDSYIVTFNCQDTDGNQAILLNRTVTVVAADIFLPTLTDDTPNLDLDTSTLSFVFNEAINAPATTLSGITISDSLGGNGVTLDGAAAATAAGDSNTLVITLTASQTRSIIALNTGANTPVQINVTTTAIKDLSGNDFAGLDGAELTISNDNTPPTLTDLTPNLDIAAATLSFAFDEHINVSTISLQNISITDATGTGTVLLTGATLPATNSSSFIIGLTTAQIQQLGTLTFDDNAGTPLQITVSPSAITDLTGNAFGGLVAGTAIDTTDDSTAPTLTSTILNLDTAILVLTFNEAIVWSDTTLDNITITDSNNANPVTLTGANLTDNNLPTLTITLTESQRQSVVTLNTGSNSPVQITVAANSIHDLVGNVFAPLTNGALTITDDNTPPTLTDLTPNLDITAATLSFAFDEHINVSTISLQNISITDATGTGTVLLTGATLPATNSSSVIIGLTTAQVQQLGTLTFDDNAGTPLQITVSSSAITDLTGNAFDGLVAGTAIDTTDDSTAPTLTNTTLNLDTAILVLTFNEAIVWSDTTLDNITITDSNNANPVTLTGANLTDNNLPTLTITLTESQRQSVVTLNTGSNSPVQITVAANSIHDIVGNVFAPLTNGALTITDDNTPPTLTDLTPNLDIAAATLSFAFDEHINVSTISLQNISITDAAGTTIVPLTGATLPATNSSSVIIGLTTAQVQQLGTLTFDDNAGTPLQITVSPSAITDLTGNAFGGLVAGTAIDTTDDSTAPTLTSTTLNLDTAILVLTFNEAIVWSDTTLDNITITDSNNANPVTLTGANLTDNNLPTLTITLTESQRQSVVTLNTGSNSPVQITVAANSIHDLVGNVFASLTNGALTITDDNTPPTLTDLTPNLNIAAATLSFAFDEHINVSTISLQNISITDATGTATVPLTGATLPATNSSSVIIGLTTAQIQQLGTLTFDDSTGTPLQITVSSSAITDLTGNAFGGLVAGTAIDTTDDSTAPTLTSTTLNLDTAILVLTFNEAIVWSDTTLDNITITDSNNANPVTLTGANLTDNNLPTLTITLTESQRQSVVTLNTGSNSPVQITVAANSIHDLVGNVFAPLTNGALTITDDNTPPTLTDLTPNLDIAAATLSFAFDEHINVSTISLQNISITDATGTATVPLTGATLPATNSSSFIIGLTTAQIQQLGTLTFDDSTGTPLQITVSSSAITDLTGNAFGGLVAGTAIDTTDDSTAPTLTSTTLNLDTAILVLTFNEAIVWSDTTLDNITITDSNNANPVTLTGANLTDNNLPTLTITLTESQRQSVVTLNTGSNSPVQITVAANSIHDLVGNVFASLTNGALTITDDNTPPTLTDLTPNLNIAAATLSFAFDEHINVSTISLQNISITDATGTATVPLTGATLPATNSSSFIIGLTTAQIQQLGTLTFDDSTGTPLQITVSSSAITDLTGNAFGGLVAGTAIDTTDDSTAPTLTSTTLNLDTAILVLTFNEAIVWSDTTLDNITITDSNNANPVTLTGANLTDNNLPTLTITLTESQRQSVVTLNTGSNSPVQITVAANSIHDLVGNVFAPLTNGALTITDDNTPPTLTDLTPNLDIAAATLSFAFDEHINVSTISLQNISITDATGTGTVLLTGATLPATNSSSFIIGLTTAQIQQLGTLTFDDDTPLQITVSSSAITDLTGNAFGGLVAGTAIDTTDDSTAPTLTSTTLNLDTAILVLTFNEAIVWSDTSNNANPVTLTGANLTDNNLPTLTITLTESQRQSVVTLNTGSNSPVQITVAANSIHDLVGNVFAPLTNGALTITDDNTPPTLTDLTPNLDIAAATLSFAFDEHINVSTISLQNISITDATGTGTVLLTGATLPATNSSSFIIGLTTAQIQQLGTLTFDDDTPLQITVSSSAITDLTGNAFGGLVAGTAIDTTDDSTAPTLTSTTLNLDTAILVLTFNEAIVWSDTTLDNITITDSNNANPVTLTGANLTDNNLPTLTITLTESQRQSVVTLNTGSNSPVQITVAANSIHDLVGNVFAPLTNGALTITDDNTPPTLTDLTPNLNIAAATLSFAFDEHINVSTISLQNISITDATGTATVLLTGATLPATNSSSVIIGLTTAQIQQLGTLTFDDSTGTPLQITVSPSAITDLTGNAFGGLVAGTAIDTTDDSTAPTLTSTTLNLDTAILVLTFNEAIVWSDTTLDNITITDSNNANPVTLTGANLTDNNLPTLTITLTESQRQSVVTLNTGSNSPVQITVAANSIHDLVGNVFAPLTNGALTITDDNTPPTLTDLTPNLDIAAATLSFAFDEHINVSTISLQNISITDATGTASVLLTGATLPATNSSSVIIGLTTAQVQQLGTLTFDDNAGTPLQITVSPSAITDLTGNAFGGLVAGTAIDTTDDSTAPTLTSTTLNLDTAILVLTFNEAIVWSDTTLDNITITDSNNANPVTLTGANLTDNNLPTLTITLTESQRQSVVTLNTGSNSPVQITVAANSIHDLVGNVFASLTNGALTITDDNTPPTLTDLTPNLNIAAATLSFAFDEHINVSTISLQNISITDATGTATVPLTGATLPATNSSSVIIGLTTAQIQQLGTLTFDDNAGTPLQITVSPSAITDLTGNAFGGLVAGTAIDTTDDSTAPTLTNTTLNLDTAILVLTFNEAIVWSDTTLDNITITDSNNANPVTLTGANLTDNNLPTLTITLTESQRQSVVTLNTGSNSPVQITVAANSIHDLVGNVFAPLTNGALTITDDNTPPTLTDLTPNLNIAAATLSFAFDEHINVSTISLQNISITDATGTATVPLTGATLPATNSSSFIIGLTTAQIQQLGTLTFDDSTGTPLQITVSSSAITDLTGNAFGGLVAGTAIDTTDDSTAPTLTSTTLNLDTAILVLTFNEAIVWSDTTLDNITITDSNNANPVTLTGANLTDNNLPTLTITLTESQRQSVVTLNTGSNSPVQITVAANSIHDLVGNVFASLTNGALTITDDNTPPTLTDLTPNLDIAAATLSFAFDEHINVSTISLQNISITDATGTATVPLTGATLPATNSSSFIIGLTTAQIQQLGTLTFDDSTGTPLQITVSSSAITDLTGNAFGGLVAGTAIDTTDDSTAPTLTSTTLNLDTAILVLTFNEAIVWSDTTLDNITITDSNNANPVTLTGANLTDNNLPTLTITLTESQRQSVVTLNTAATLRYKSQLRQTVFTTLSETCLHP